jgi:cupin superfamily acireductone dioxygenase involved in methionine salvage
MLEDLGKNRFQDFCREHDHSREEVRVPIQIVRIYSLKKYKLSK